MLKRVIAVLREGMLCGVALCCPAAQALDELWHFDLVSGSRSLPAPIDLDGDGEAEVLATTRFDGTVWTLGQDGTQRSQYRRNQWIEGPLAVSEPVEGRARLLAIQESTGLLNLVGFHTGLNLTLEVPGEPRIGTMPCFADLNRSGRPELVVARRNGVLTAMDRRLAVLWQYNAGSPFDSSPVVAPVFMSGAVVCAQSVDGVVHGVHGDGTPLWRFAPQNPAPAFPQIGDLLVVELQAGSPVVLAGDRDGWLYAIDAISGREHWRAQAGTAALGSPAIADVHEAAGREVITVSAAGEICILNSGGKVLVQGRLPEAAYVPRPLVADVDGDGAYEIVIPAREWRIVTASLSGDVKEEIALQGNAREGIVLADGNRDGLLELYAVTDSARAYCFATQAREGWTHPRGGPAFGGFVPPISQAYEQVHPLGKERAPRRLRVTIPEINRGSAFSIAVVDMDGPRKQDRVAAVLRQHDRVLGSSVAVEDDGRILIPYWRDNPAPLTLDLLIASPSGETRAHYGKIPVEVSPAKPVLLPSRDEFATALGALGAKYVLPESWRLPKAGGRDSWTVATYMPEAWKTFGIADEAFIRDAVPRIDAPANKRVFGPAHPAWATVCDTKRPFFLMNGYFQPAGRYSEEAYAAIVNMAGERFLGFPVHEWAYRVWKEELESGEAAPKNRKEATAILKADFERLMYETHGRIYAGEGYCMTQHQAYAWGSPICYAELGENIPCAPLQFAFLRGAARQYGNKPWGAYISNWFRGSVLDSRLRSKGTAPVQWSPPEDSAGPDCGHSASLEFRLAMAAHLAGATFIHHESDAFHDSVFVKEESNGRYALSGHGHAMQQWFDFAQGQSERGVPYTPIAFVIDFDHGWRPREPIYGIWPQDTATASLEKMFRHVFAWDGRLDFERGYLTHGPYGDVFDVLTNYATEDTLRPYGVLWPLGDVGLNPRRQEVLESYVAHGGVLVVDYASARDLPAELCGVTFTPDLLHGTGIQTALQSMPAIPAPFAFAPMKLGKNASALAWTESGAPLLAWHSYGKGMVIVSATENWLDVREELVPIAGAILRSLADAFVPVSTSADVQMTINRTPNGYVIGLINNSGVEKVPTAPPTVDEAGAKECAITFSGKTPLRIDARMGDFQWIVPANSLATRIPSGGVAVVEVTLPSRN